MAPLIVELVAKIEDLKQQDDKTTLSDYDLHLLLLSALLEEGAK